MSRILLVDDDQNIRRLIMSILRQQGHTVHVAYDGREAIRLLSVIMPEVLVTDLLMPRMPGLELINAAREDLPGLPIVVVSAYTNYTREALEADGIHTLKKPFSQDDLVSVVNQAITPQM
jgi:CheY-like chemotaxis protein